MNPLPLRTLSRSSELVDMNQIGSLHNFTTPGILTIHTPGILPLVWSKVICGTMIMSVIVCLYSRLILPGSGALNLSLVF